MRATTSVSGAWQAAARVLGLLAGAALLAAPIAACGQSQGKEKQATLKKTVRVQPVARGDIDLSLSYVADLKPYVEVRIFSPVPDRILRFPVNDGDEVRAGALLALVRKEGLDKGLEGMAAQMEALDAQVANLERELARSKELQAAGVITRQVFDQVQTSYLATKAQRRALEASKDQLAVTAGNALITAPISGVVADKMLQAGDMAIPSIPLCRVLQIDKLKAELRLIEEDVAKVREGQEVAITLDAYPGKTFSGRVQRIMPFVNALTRTNLAEVVIDNPLDKASGTRLLKPGMFGRAALVVERRQQVIVAPEPALLLDSQVLARQEPGQVLRKAFVVDGGSLAQQRLVRLGARQGTLYEILDGLAPGEQLVVRGQHGLKAGQAVEVLEADGTAQRIN